MNIWQRAWHLILGDSPARFELAESEPVVSNESEETVVPVEPPPEVVKILILKGPLPSDFPALDKLHEAGINTYGQLAKIENLKIVVGIGPKTAEKIADRIVEDLKDQE